jgi:DNA polymerase I
MTFGFVGMLLKLLRGQGGGAMGGPTRTTSPWPSMSPATASTFRSELYPEYKATRPPRPRTCPRSSGA